MRAQWRALDWAATPLGAAAQWSPALLAAAGLMLEAPGAMCLYAGDAFVTLYNDGYRRLLGTKHPAALGCSAEVVWGEIWPVIGPQYEGVWSGGGGLDLRDVPFTLPRLDGGGAEECWFDYALSAVRTMGEGDLEHNGGVVAILSVVSETTNQVRSKREVERLLAALEVERSRLADVFRAAPAFLAVLRGPAHVFTLVNDAYYQLVGHREMVGKPVIDALPELQGQGFVELLNGVLTTGDPFIGREVPVDLARTPGAEPEERFIDLTYKALTEVDGTRVGVIAHGTDVTEQVVARREVERLLAESLEARQALDAAREEAVGARQEADVARAAAELANRSKSEFLAVMSHELRTPLNAIGGYAELMELGVRGPTTEEQREDLGRIQRSQRHLLGLVNEVLNYTRLEAGTVRYDVADVRVGDAVADAQALVAPQARAKGLVVEATDCVADLMVRADPEKLRQVLVNLLSNAVKFTGARDGALGTFRVTCDAAGDRVRITVGDTGIGIAPEKLDSVFEPFVQVRADLTRTAEGTGLGLAISRDLARGMGGELTVESTVGVGSRFTLTLPPV
ncbi:MAG: PAS domain-containing sensor histidine kinase [Gemmatimonadota bacterium]